MRGDVDVGIIILNIVDPRRDNVVKKRWPECLRTKSVITNSSVLCVSLHPIYYNSVTNLGVLWLDPHNFLI